MSWEASNKSTWYERFISTFWNALRVLWDDPVITWDAISQADWNETNKSVFQAKNTKNWKTKTNGNLILNLKLNLIFEYQTNK